MVGKHGWDLPLERISIYKPSHTGRFSSQQLHLLWVSNAGETGPSDVRTIWEELDKIFWMADLVVQTRASDSGLEGSGSDSSSRHDGSSISMNVTSIDAQKLEKREAKGTAASKYCPGSGSRAGRQSPLQLY